MLAPIDDPIMAGFVKDLDKINALAEESKGFKWRLKDEENNATSIRVFIDDKLLINMSVWEDKASLFDFTYKSVHVEVLGRKKEWFSKMEDMHMVLWYVAEGHTPSPEEANERLAYLNAHGASPYAFDFKNNFTIQDMLAYKPLKDR